MRVGNPTMRIEKDQLKIVFMSDIRGSVGVSMAGHRSNIESK